MSSASDLLLHLRPCRLTAVFLDEAYTIPALDAVEWIALLDGEAADLYEIFPKLAGVEAIEAVEDALWDERATRDEVGKIAYDLISTAADRPWWVVVKMIGVAKGAWDRVHVNNAVGMSLAGWLDQVWTNMLNHVDPKKRAAWISDMQRAPKGWDEQVDVDEEEQAFLNAMNAVMR